MNYFIAGAIIFTLTYLSAYNSGYNTGYSAGQCISLPWMEQTKCWGNIK